MSKIMKEVDWYPYIKRLLEFRGIKILQNEVKFLEQLKTIDLFGEDCNHYYIMEVKRNNTSYEDYYNLDYIIKNNRLDKPIKGILFGKCKESSYLYKKILKNSSMELITFDDKWNNDRNKEMIFKNNIKHSKRYFNEKRKYIRYFIDDIIDIDIKKIYIDVEYIGLEYKIDSNTFFKVGFNIDNFYNKHSAWLLEGKMYIDEYDSELDKVISKSIKRIGQRDIRNELYKAKLLNIKYFKDNNNCKYLLDLWNIYGNLKILLKYMVIGDLIENLNHDKFIIDEDRHGVQFLKLEENWNNMIWCSARYGCMFTRNKEKDNTILKLNYDVMRENYLNYNKINHLESINIIYENKLFEPVKQLIYNGDETTIILNIKIKRNKKK